MKSGSNIFASYKNHVVHTSIYAAILAHFVQQLTSEVCWTSFAVLAGAGLALLLIKGEVRYMVRRSRLPPGDSGYPIVGHLPQFLKNPFGFLSRFEKRYGDLYTFNMLGHPSVAFTSDEDAAWFVAQERKGNFVPSIMPQLAEMIGDQAITFASGKHHKRLRRVFDPAYSPSALKNYVNLMDEIAQAMLEQWAASKEYQTEDQWSMLAMKIFCSCTFGEEFSRDQAKLDRIFSLFQGFYDGLAFPIKYPGSPLTKAHKYKKEMDQIVETMIEDFRKKCPPESQEAKATVMGRLCYGVDDDGNPLTQDQLVSNICFVMFAGHDTIKGSFSAFLKYLVESPAVHEALYQEVKDWDTLDHATLKEAPVLNAFLLETWRMTAPVYGHNAKSTIDLEYKGYLIPAGTGVAVTIQNYNLGSTTRFPSPDLFEIGRFLPTDHELHNPQLHAAANDSQAGSVRYRTFGVGPHSCLGIHFAKLEAAIVLTRLIQNYNVQVQNERTKNFPMMQVALDFLLTARK